MRQKFIAPEFIAPEKRRKMIGKDSKPDSTRGPDSGPDTDSGSRRLSAQSAVDVSASLDDSFEHFTESQLLELGQVLDEGSNHVPPAAESPNHTSSISILGDLYIGSEDPKPAPDASSTKPSEDANKEDTGLLSLPDLVSYPEDDLSKLSNPKLGLPSSLLSSYKSVGIDRIYPWQYSCLSIPGVLDGKRNLVYAAPTSAGKTLVSELLVAKRCSGNSKQKGWIPILSNDFTLFSYRHIAICEYCQ